MSLDISTMTRMVRVMLTRYEQETVIGYNNEEKTATLYTADPVVIRRMDRLCEKRPEYYRVIKEEMYKGELLSKTYEFPKKLIKFYVPQVYTEEQLENLRRKGRELYEKYGSSEKYDGKETD